MAEEDTCATCGQTGLQVTVRFDRHDPASITQALREVVSPEVLRIVALSELGLATSADVGRMHRPRDAGR